MNASYENAIMVHPVSGDKLAGFYVEGGNDNVLVEYIAMHYTKEVVAGSEEEAYERLLPVRLEIEALGYAVGPFETRTHKEWCVEVLGTDPDVYDANQLAEWIEEDEQ